jgi:hypothetical protein
MSDRVVFGCFLRVFHGFPGLESPKKNQTDRTMIEPYFVGNIDDVSP